MKLNATLVVILIALSVSSASQPPVDSRELLTSARSPVSGIAERHLVAQSALEGPRDYAEQRSPSAVSSLYTYLNQRQQNTPVVNATQPQRALKSQANGLQKASKPVALGDNALDQHTRLAMRFENQLPVNYFGPPAFSLDPQLSNSMLDPLSPALLNQHHFVLPPGATSQRTLEEFYPTGFDRQPIPNFNQLPAQGIRSGTNQPHSTLRPTLHQSKSISVSPKFQALNRAQPQQIDKPIRLSASSQKDVRHKLQSSNSRPKHWTHIDRTLSKAMPNKRPKNLLSNDQLMSLIDELKEFNSKQASVIRSAPPRLITDDKPPADYPPIVRQNQEELVRDTASRIDKNEITDEQQSEKPAEGATTDDSKMNTAELAKFAKFLMSKEGANMKFQLGLDRDSPDDGDEDDDRDALLESKKKTSKAELKDTDWDAKHLELAKQLDSLVDKVSSQTSKPKNGDDSDDGFERDKARRRRDDSMKTKEENPRAKLSRETPVNHQILKSTHNSKPAINTEENFAKSLIKQELLEDQLESNQSPVSKNKKLSDRKQESNSRADFKSPDDHHRINAESNQQYEPNERLQDVTSFTRELDRARDNTNRVRTRMRTPLDSILRKALEGRLGVRAQRKGKDKLLIKGSNGSSLEVELPKREAELHRTSRVEQDNPAEGEEDSKNSELVAAQAEPDGNASGNIQRINLQKGTPVRDEYPVSERVTDRLNKLSRNLDQYFNDGFLKEIEEKSQMKDNPENSDSENQQPQATNVKPSTRKTDKNINRRDADFDVNVGVDGQEDQDSDNDDYTDSEVKKQRKAIRTPVTSKRKRKFDKVQAKKKKKRISPKDESGSNVYPGSVVHGMKKRVSPKKDESEVRRTLSEESSGRENTEYENHSKIMPDLDPVEVESLETPIGPDGDTVEPDLNSVDHVKVTSGSSNVSSKATNGTTTGEKFFEEPSWH